MYYDVAFQQYDQTLCVKFMVLTDTGFQVYGKGVVKTPEPCAKAFIVVICEPEMEFPSTSK